MKKLEKQQRDDKENPENLSINNSGRNPDLSLLLKNILDQEVISVRDSEELKEKKENLNLNEIKGEIKTNIHILEQSIKLQKSKILSFGIENEAIKKSLTALKDLLTTGSFWFIIKAISPYLIVFIFTLIQNAAIKKNKVICLGAGTNHAPDNCVSFWDSFILTFVVIQTYSSGHFLFGSSLLSKYSNPNRKKCLILMNLHLFCLTHIIVLNGPFLKENVCILFKIFFIVIINAFSFITLSRFIGHPKPFTLMKNYFFFELFTCSIPTITVLSSKLTYPLFIKTGSKGVALFLTSIVNSIFSYFFQLLMQNTILAENPFLENIDLMPGSHILTGYFDGLFFGNLLPQDIDTFGFWFNVISYYGYNIATITGIRARFWQFIYRNRKKNLNNENKKILGLIQNGSRFFSIFPLVLTILFTQMNTPYFYGSQLYDYATFNWLVTAIEYDNQSMKSLFSYEKMIIFIVFSLVYMSFGYAFRKNYLFYEINGTVYLKNIFYTFKICTMFTIGFDYSVQVANVVHKDVIDQMFGPYWRLVGIGN